MRCRAFLLAGLLLVPSTACESPRRTPPGAVPHGSVATDPVEASPAGVSRTRVGPVAFTTASAGSSVDGRDIPYSVLGDGARTILVLATIHGDEAAGTPLVEDLVERLREDRARLAGRRVVVVPVVNPDGYAANRRTNSRGVDLNRNFPASNHVARRRHGSEPLSEPESQALATLLMRHEPDVVVSIHQPVACVDYDGPADGLARAMSDACDLPVRRLGSRPGSLGSHLGLDRGIPIVTFELPRSADDLPRAQLWDRYGPALLAAIDWEG